MAVVMAMAITNFGNLLKFPVGPGDNRCAVDGLPVALVVLTKMNFIISFWATLPLDVSLKRRERYRCLLISALLRSRARPMECLLIGGGIGEGVNNLHLNWLPVA